MRLHLITVGAPKLAYARAGWQEYTARLGRYHKLTITHLSGSTPHKEGEATLKAAGRAPIIALDPRGAAWTSEQVAAYIERQGVQGTGELAFCIGGPDGHSDELRAQARALWSLSNLTLPHDLAMVVMSEALYRAATISAGEPYHR